MGPFIAFKTLNIRNKYGKNTEHIRETSGKNLYIALQNPFKRTLLPAYSYPSYSKHINNQVIF